MVKDAYISKTEALKRGYVLGSDGIYYKKSVLEKYCENGYLHIDGSKFSDEDRCRAGLMLAKDYYLGKYNTLQSKQLHLTNIRTTATADRESAIYHQERYLSAIKSIPYEFWQAVRVVCIEDKELRLDKEKSYGSLNKKNIIYHQKMLLSLGLERLIKHYLQKNKKSA